MTAGVRKAYTIAGVNLRRWIRDRGNLFFAFVFPIAMILVIGLQFGGDADPRLGVVGAEGATAGAMLEEIAAGRADVEIVRVRSAERAVDRVESMDLDAVVLVPADLDVSIAAGRTADVEIVAGTTIEGRQLTTIVDGALARAVAAPSAVTAVVALGADPAAASSAAEQLATALERIGVRTITTGDRLFPEGTGGFDVAAPSMMVLFVFVNGLAGSYALIQSRQLGVSRRMLSTPTTARAVIFGEGLGRLAIAIVEGVYIVVATLVVFAVDWGDLIGAAAIIVAVAAVSAGAAMCFGTFFSNPDQASGIGVVASLALAALGGAMLPIELFGDTLATVARFTPHYWAIDAFAELIRHDGTVLDIGRQLGVLVVYAAILMIIASWRMRIVLTSGR